MMATVSKRDPLRIPHDFDASLRAAMKVKPPKPEKKATAKRATKKKG